jgi:hypothetical protein
MYPEELFHLGVAAVLDLLGDPVALPDDVLDSEATDDRPQVPGEDPADEHLHPVLLGQEPARRVRDRGLVIPHLERGHRADIQPDALAGDALLDDLRLAQGQGKHPRLLLHRGHETAMPGDDAELRPLALPLRTGDEQRLVGRRDMPKEHDRLLGLRLDGSNEHRAAR